MQVSLPSISVINAVSERREPSFPMSFGTLHILRLIRPVRMDNAGKQRVLQFKGVPFSRSSKATSLRIRFVDDERAPMPQFDAVSGSIDLCYPSTAISEVQDLLRSGRERFCYYWKSADGSSCRAWLMASP
jgi:hypothetical protein